MITIYYHGLVDIYTVISNKEELLKLLDAVSEVSLLVVGDIILDRYIWGSVSRISPEAPVPVVSVEKIEDRLGGAGNVVRNIVSLGGKVTLCGFIGDDQEGKTVLQLLEQDNVNRDGVMIDRSRPTTVKTRVIAHRQQVVRIDREEKAAPAAALSEGFATVVEAQLNDVSGVIVSDYAKGAISAPLMKRLSNARANGLISLAERPLIVDPKPVNSSLYQGVSVATPNRREAEKISGIKIIDRESTLEAGRKLLSDWQAEMMMVTLGEDGLMIISSQEDKGVFLDTVAQEVYDVSGAGDTVVAVFSAALAAGAPAELAGDLANIAAGVVVSEVGTVPITRQGLENAIKKLSPSKG
ncbi:MAG: D-glycero-beta-D-manno-heptose-7-phosphate kinase [Candidatus Dadabacteria bacterium]|nr:MAG: D-glycero-beta-D-manno-heptose-7-phosphate kinase [Candidatus Dadabacteria bacterium]